MYIGCYILLKASNVGKQHIQKVGKTLNSQRVYMELMYLYKNL